MIALLLVSFAASTEVYRFENPPPNGWWLVVEAVDTKAYLLTGESLSRFPVKLSLVNLSAEVRSYVPLKEASKGGVLALRAVQNDKIAPHVMPFPPIPPSRIGRPALGPGQVSEMTVGMGHFGYTRLETAGKIEAKARLETDNGPVVSAPFHIRVLDIAPRDIKLSKTVPLTESATRTDGTAPHVVIQLVDVGGDRWLVYRRFYGPKHGGGIAFTERLAPAKGLTDFAISGSFGDDKPLTVTFTHASGEKAVLEIETYFERVVKRQGIKK